MNTSSTSISLKRIIPLVVLIVAFATVLALAQTIWATWKAPSSAPPTGNVEAPINVGTQAQTKEGGLLLKGKLAVGKDLTPVPTSLSARIKGDVGADRYCDASGNNCFELPLVLPHGQCASGYMAGWDAAGKVVCVDPPPTSPKVFNTPGTWSWTIPKGIGNTVVVKINGAGGSSGKNNCYGNQCFGGYGGGGGGGFAGKTYTVNPGDTFTFTIGAGVAGGPGQTTTFNGGELVAEGGKKACDAGGSCGGAPGCGTQGPNVSCGGGGGSHAIGPKGNTSIGGGGAGGGGTGYGRGASGCAFGGNCAGQSGAVIFEW